MRFVIAPLLGLALLGGCDRQSAPAPQADPANLIVPPATKSEARIERGNAGKTMPTIGFTGPDDKPLTLAAFKGKPVLVNLWATWCAPCVAEMPTLDALAARETGRVQVIAISQDMKGRAAVSEWWGKAKLAALVPYLDEKADLSFALGGGELPMTVMYDAAGKEVWRVAGPMDWAGVEAKALIDEGAGG